MANEIKFKILGDVKDLQDSIKSSSRTMKDFGSKMSTFMTVPIGLASGAMIKFASDSEEVANKFNVVFREMRSEATSWAEQFGNSVGRSNIEIQQFSSSLGDVLKPLGFTTQEAFKMSSQMTQLALDVASFNNRQDSDVVRAFTSALTGERESLKTLGIVISEADVKQEAYASGIAMVGEELTKTQKAQATVNLLFKNSTDAQGDLARTQDSFANSSKALAAELKDLSATFGQQLLPSATKFAKSATTVLKAISKLDTNTQSVILAFGGLVAVAGPALFVIGTLGSQSAALAATMPGLSAGIGAVVTSLTVLGGLGAAAFVGWNLGKLISELEVVQNAINDLAFGLDKIFKFGLQDQKDAAEAFERNAALLNEMAVARKAAADAARESAMVESSIETDSSQQKIAAMQQYNETKLFSAQQTMELMSDLDSTFREAAALRSQEELADFISAQQQKRDALISFYDAQQSLLEENNMLSVEKKAEYEQQKQDIYDRFAFLEEQSEKMKQNKLGFWRNQGLKEYERVKGNEIEVLGDTLKKAGQLNKTAGKIYQAFAITKAIVNTSLGVTQALAMGNIPTAIVIAASGAAEVATIASQSFAVGTPEIPRDMTASVHKGEMIIPQTFSSAIRSGELTLSGGSGDDEGARTVLFDFSGTIFNGVTQEFVEDVFEKASELIENKSLIFGVS